MSTASPLFEASAVIAEGGVSSVLYTVGRCREVGKLWGLFLTWGPDYVGRMKKAKGVCVGEVSVYSATRHCSTKDLTVYTVMWTCKIASYELLKGFLEFVTILFLFYVLVFWLRVMWDLSFPTRDWTFTPCIGRLSLNYLTAREVPKLWTFMFLVLHCY